MTARAGGDPLVRLFAPRSVAVIGASADPKRIGGRPIACMLERGVVEMVVQHGDRV